MESRISATELARSLGDVLARVRYRGESFVVERNGKGVARVGPLAVRRDVSIREALAAWRAVGRPEPQFADDLEEIGRLDRPPDSPWDS